jgi:glutamate transport system substrate-binding protein
MSRNRRWRAATAAGATLAALSLVLSAFGSSGNDSVGSDAKPTGVFADAPVASSIPAGSTMDKIKKRGVLVVAAALDAPLLSQQDPTDPKKVEGFDITLAKLLATYIIGKPNVKIVPPASQTREAMLQNKTVDVVFNTYTITPERAQQVQFAGPYFTSGLAIATPTGKGSQFKSLADLAGKKVIVGANTPAVDAVKQAAPTAQLVTFDTDPQAVQALAQGRGDAYVQDYLLLATDAVSNKQIQVATGPLTKEPYGIGLPPNDPDFKKFVNDWLTKVESGGQWAKAFDDSIGKATGLKAPEPPQSGSVPGS